MPTTPTATPPTTQHNRDLTNKRNIKEKQVENNFTSSIFYFGGGVCIVQCWIGIGLCANGRTR